VLILGVYYKLQTFIYLSANGIVQGIRPLIGYNLGAGERGRVRKIYQTALILGAEAVKDREYFDRTRGEIMDTREWTKGELRRLGFCFGDSRANFIFAAHERVPAEKIFQALREQPIYVRYFRKPRISNYLRITIGTREEMRELIDFLEHWLPSANEE